VKGEPSGRAVVPGPPGLPAVGHLWHWARAPLPLLAAGARTGPVFRLRLWRPALVGYRPEWNRAVLTDLEMFRSRGSLSGLVPYLSDGIIHTDVPEHRVQRRRLNPCFSAHALAGQAGRLHEVSERHRPDGSFEALEWSGPLVGDMLNTVLFGGAVPAGLLTRFLRPLHRRMPSPLLPRPGLFRRVGDAIARVLQDPPAGSIAAALAGHPDAVTELRVALAAGYDTTSHTLAWSAWHLGAHPLWRHPQALPMFIDEMLRLYPAGWLGSRVASRDSAVTGIVIPAGTLVLYSPYLTHRDPGLWPDPHRVRPGRFESGHPPWSYIPFAAGPRACLGARLARLMLHAALCSLGDGTLTQAGTGPGIATGVTLMPGGPLHLRFSRRRATEGPPAHRSQLRAGRDALRGSTRAAGPS
jgi:cytochrome P450